MYPSFVPNCACLCVQELYRNEGAGGKLASKNKAGGAIKPTDSVAELGGADNAAGLLKKPSTQ